MALLQLLSYGAQDYVLLEERNQMKMTNKPLMPLHNTDPSLFINMDDSYECGICMEILCKEQFGILECKHMFCSQCIKTQIEKNITRCAFCRQNINNITFCNYEKIE